MVAGALAWFPTSAAEQLAWRLQAEYPHDSRHFTQGLELHEGRLYESVGLYGQSAVMSKDLETGETLASRYLPADVFAEGLTRTQAGWVQLSWRERRLFVYDDALKPIATQAYPYEGWGAAALETPDGQRLVTSDGSATLRVLAPPYETVERQFEVVDDDGGPVERLNELEAIGRYIVANVWQEDRIVVIDAIGEDAGLVVAELDLSELRTLLQRQGTVLQEREVLNGIAWDAQQGRLLVTGKLWPALYAIEVKDAPWETRGP